MSIATFDENPWVATVYYVFDDDLNLYFLSDKETEHVQALMNNPRVACAIFDSSTKLSEVKKGLQVHGTAKQVTGLKTIKIALKMWNALDPKEPDLSIEDVKKSFFQVTPKRIKYFNKELFQDVSDGILEL